MGGAQWHVEGFQAARELIEGEGRGIHEDVHQLQDFQLREVRQDVKIEFFVIHRCDLGQLQRDEVGHLLDEIVHIRDTRVHTNRAERVMLLVDHEARDRARHGAQRVRAQFPLGSDTLWSCYRVQE